MTSSNTLIIEATMITKADRYKYLRVCCHLLVAIGLISFVIPAFAASNLTFDPSSPFFFGDIQVSSTSGTESVELLNDGSSTLTIDEVTKSSTAGCSHFIVQFQQIPVNLENGEFAIMELAFAPNLRGSHSCDIQVISNDPDGTSIYTIHGTGVGSELTVEAGPMIFADTHIGDSSEPQYFTLSNVGDTGFPLTISDVSIQASDNDEDYVIGGFLGGTIFSGASELVEVTFLPQSAGNQNATIEIRSDANVNPFVEKELVGRGTERLISYPSTVDFRWVFLGQAEIEPINILNGGEATLLVSDLTMGGVDAGDFSIVQPELSPTPESPIEITGGSDYQILVECAPVTPGRKSSTLVVSSNADNETQSTVELICNGEEAPEIIFLDGFEIP
jgi:hypothetical protein